MRMKNPFDDEPGDEEEGSAKQAEQPDQQDDSPEVTEARSDDEPSADSATEQSSRAGDGGSNGGGGESSMTAAPSIGPNTVIEREPPEERLDFDKISDTDAMGKDKRREVVGETYGPTRTRVFATFATFIAVVAALVVGFYFLAKELDQPPSENPDDAPWALPEAPQQPPKPIQ